MSSTSMKSWLEVLAATVVAFTLSYVTVPILDRYSLVLAILPLVFISLRRGLIPGLLAGMLTGALVLLFRDQSGEIMERLVVSFGPFAFVGIAGLFAKYTQRTLNNKRFPNAALNIVTASLFGSLIYFVWTFIASVMLDGTVAADALELHGLSFLFTFLVTAAVLLVLAKVGPKAFVPKDTRFLSRKEKSRLLND